MHRVEIAFGRGLRMELKTKDIVFVVSDDEGKLGELHVSKGPVDWLSRNAQARDRLPWDRFGQVMEENSRWGGWRGRPPVKAKRAGATKKSRRTPSAR
jgi:hypothetical protein